MKALIGSLCGKFVKVVNDEGKCVYDYIVVCPHCGSTVEYGDLYVTKGVCNCPNCNDELKLELANRGIDDRDWEPYGIERDDIALLL